MLTKQHFSTMIFCAFAFFAMKAGAQDHAEKNWYGSVHTGVVFNKSEVNAQPGIAGGLQWKGLGAGFTGSIDFMEIRSLQYGIGLHKSISLQKIQLLAFVSPGINHVIATQDQKEKFSRFYSGHRFENGRYLEAGAGIVFGKNKNLLAAFYWSRKTYKETFNNSIWNPVSLEIEEYRASRKYEMNRLGLKIGFMF